MTTNEIPDDTPWVLDTDVPPVDGRVMDHKAQPKKKDKGPIPARQGNGYYADHLTGDRLRSVTTILSGGVPKPALMFWAARVVAESAVEHLPQLVAASRDREQLEELVRWIKNAHTRKKDERADVGSAVHAIIESRLLGQPIPDAIKVGDELVALDSDDLAPFVTQIDRFLSEWHPEFTASEMVVANPTHGYAGTLDFMLSGTGLVGDALRAAGYVVNPKGDIMGDTKTGGDWVVPEDGKPAHPKVLTSGHIHGVYPEAGLQMSAYRKAETAWLRDGSRVPMPATAEVGVILHLRPEGYRLFPVYCGDAEYRYFRYAQVVDEWASRVASPKADRPIVGKALVLPS